MPTIIATLGAADANSLVTRAEADAYFDLGLGGCAWEDLDEDIKERALVSATRDFQAIPWNGCAVSSTQALAWPRRLPGASDGLTLPANVKAALCEHALDLVQREASKATGGADRAQLRAEGVTSYRIGDRSETLAQLGAGALAEADAALSGKVQRLLTGWIRRAGTMDSGRRPTYAGGHYDANGLWWPSELMP